MVSINTNTSAMAALQTLRSTQSDMAATQNRIATGQRVNTAADNAAYWSIATTMRSDAKALTAVGEALGMGAAKVDVAASAMNSAIEVVDEIKGKLLAAKEGSLDKAKLDGDIKELQKQLVSITEAASFSGANWLRTEDGATAPGTQNILASYTRGADGSTKANVIEVDTTEFMLIDAGTASNGILSQERTGGNDGAFSVVGGDNAIALSAATTDAQLDDMIEAVEGALKDMTDGASVLGATSRRIEIQDSFISQIKDSIDRGIGRLVDADMAQESTKLQALQVQQQLGIQALSIANQNSQAILALFR